MYLLIEHMVSGLISAQLSTERATLGGITVSTDGETRSQNINKRKTETPCSKDMKRKHAQILLQTSSEKKFENVSINLIQN